MTPDWVYKVAFRQEGVFPGVGAAISELTGVSQLSHRRTFQAFEGSLLGNALAYWTG